MKRFIFLTFSVFLLLSWFCSPVFSDDAGIPEKKQTQLKLYLTAREAYDQWKVTPDVIKIIDCRTPEEYIFVGHAPMAYNIPVQFLKYRYNAEKKKPDMEKNPDFVKQVQARFKPDDKIFVMCRSGSRSAASADALIDAGFTDVYNIIDGFEGDRVKDPDSCYDGKRMKNGWKNSGNPWTYNLDPDRMYLVNEEPENKKDN